jgi:hypothetical protein
MPDPRDLHPVIKARDIKVPRAAGSEFVYERSDGRRFEKTVTGPNLGRCTACLAIVKIDPPTEADEHVCERWWEEAGELPAHVKV